jgi:hypothetical protein
MSQIASYHTEIRLPPSRLVSIEAGLQNSPCMEILRLACEKVTRDHGGILSQAYQDNRGQIHKTLIAVQTNNFPRGIGLNVGNDGRLIFSYDSYAGDEESAQEICWQIRQTYLTIALLRCLNQLGFNLETREKDVSASERVIVISGRKCSGEGVNIAVGQYGALKLDFVGYQGLSCTGDEIALRRSLQAQNIEVTVEAVRRKRDEEDLAGWSNAQHIKQELG